MKHLLIASLAGLVFVGCDISTDGTSEYDTDEMDAKFIAENDGDNLIVTASLSTGNSSELILLYTDGGDRLAASFQGETKDLERDGFDHDAEFPLDSGDLTIEFLRRVSDSATIDLYVPEQIEITAPTQDQAFNYGDGTVTLSFEGMDTDTVDDIEWEVSCKNDLYDEKRRGKLYNTIAGTSVNLSLREIFSQGPQLLDFPDGCSVKLTVDQRTQGTASEVFRDVEVRSEIVSTVKIHVSP